MKITHTDIFRFSIPMEPFAIATGTMYFAQNVFIRVYTDEGIYGVGECSAFPMIVGETQETCLVVGKEFAKTWKGKDALDIPARLQELHTLIANNTTIKSAFDMALYDLMAKSSQMPLYQYLGGTKREIESDITIGISSPENMAATAVSYIESGAKILKVKLGKDPIGDIERMAKIRKAVGKEATLRIDANQGWEFDDALLVLREIANLNIQFCEQPMRTWYDDRLPELVKLSPVKIMADESCYNHHDARKLINNKATDYINIKFSKSGGIHEALQIHDEAQAAGIKCMMGGMLESRIALSAKLHFTYACPNVYFYDLDTCKLGHLEDPVINGARYNGHHLEIDDLPGIGADADEEFLKTCEKWVI
jgi:L-Ala-D/L-Glu epimerase